ncbi:MAG TPA: ferric reductase-like transmembrane domain-containing protein [Solirubrobacterales bacterium]|nr:ferric reductase-like transmembrane domain-containing protein [Solirubrobacterales bacterium]
MNGATQALESQGWWLASRASGVVALVLVTFSVGIGLAMASKVMRGPGLSRKLMALHEHTALAGLIAIAVHGIALIGDSWLKPGVAGVTVPFVIDYRPFFTGLGIIAGYLALLLGLSFYLRQRIGAKLWRKAHRATVAVWALGLIHAIGAGSDTTAIWFRWWVIATTPLIGGLLVIRVLESRAPKEAAPAKAPKPAPKAAPRPKAAEPAPS